MNHGAFKRADLCVSFEPNSNPVSGVVASLSLKKKQLTSVIQYFEKKIVSSSTVLHQKDCPFCFFRREVSFCPILTLNSSK